MQIPYNKYSMTDIPIDVNITSLQPDRYFSLMSKTCIPVYVPQHQQCNISTITHYHILTKYTYTLSKTSHWHTHSERSGGTKIQGCCHHHVPERGISTNTPEEWRRNFRRKWNSERK